MTFPVTLIAEVVRVRYRAGSRGREKGGAARLENNHGHKGSGSCVCTQVINRERTFGQRRIAGYLQKQTEGIQAANNEMSRSRALIPQNDVTCYGSGRVNDNF
ncbi:hypothetical protein BaRGS_00015212 [Batillaria attramentaria]|uniref:Uncharacterized protein n=1 Tax=Batillaria attramentaria TaxID=370345 RepID=A0ABD0L2C6_9CAEN